jgi:multicomponent Na+:H+ antiporter subunit E
MWRRILALWCWSILIWTLLTWTPTVEQFTVGVGVSLLVALACAPLGPVAGPWALLYPRRIVPLLALVAAVSTRVVTANWHLSRLIWSMAGPPSGMVVVPTDARTDGELTTVGVLTSLIVNSQIVDLDRRRHRLQYHAVEVTSRDPDVNRDRVNRAIEERTIAVTRR